MKKFKLLLLTVFILMFAYQGKYCFAQEEENESAENILAREQFIQMRRAGGPGKKIVPDAYSKALIQKSNIIEDRMIPESMTSTINWISINPTGMFYQRTNANYISGRTNSIAFHPVNANIFYIATAQGGVWKTVDGGLNWTALTDGLPTLACGDIAVDQTNPNVLYLGTGEQNYSGDSQYGNGIYKSTNAGATWTHVATVEQVGNLCSSLAIDPANSNIVYMGGNGGIFKSTNAGLNWVNIYNTTGPYVNSLIINPSNSQIIYASMSFWTSQGHIIKSTNAGSTWTILAGGLPSGMGRIQLAIAKSNLNTLYANIANPGGALIGLYRTTNAGTTWTVQATTPDYFSNPGGSQGWYDNAVTVKPTDANYVLVGGIDCYASSTGGTSLVQKSGWNTTSSSLFCHADIHRLQYNGTVLYCCSDGGVYKSTNDGNTWIDLNQKLSTLQFQSADYDPNNLLSLQGGTQDNDKQTTTNGGTQWIQRTTGDGGYTVVDPVNTNYVYGQYVWGLLLRSANSGISFTEIAPSGSTGGLFYSPYEMAPGDHNTIVCARSDVWKTSNAQSASTSSGWTQIATTSTVGGNVSAIGISATNTGKIYIGTDNGRILVTTNNGASWSVKTGYPYVSDFIVDNTNDNICYATLGGTGTSHVLKTTNGGNIWTDITGNLPNIAANSIVMRTITPRMLIVGTDIGVFKSTNEGANWVSFNSELPSVEIYDLKYKQSIGTILAATHGRGCWTFDLNASLGIDPFGEIPLKYKLSQNYPNPFNPVTNIEFDIPKYNNVKLEIYDIRGKKIDELVNQKLNAGHYQVQWDASEYSSGTYLYKLTTPDYSSTTKMILLK